MAKKKAPEIVRPVHADQEAYDAAVQSFGEAVRAVHDGKLEAARAAFLKIVAGSTGELVLADRARAFAAACERRLAAKPAPPKDADDFYYRAIVLANSGRLDDALEMVEGAVRLDGRSAKALYARAAIHALRRSPDRAVHDLRSAVGFDPTLRFQATNDPDFDLVRDDPAFIDVVEPARSGA